MLSEKQLLANQQNALRSTGPRSAAGKAIASQNAIRHGLSAQIAIIPGENPEEFDQFRQLLLEDERTIAKNLLQQFIVYGSGAPVSFADREFVESTLDRLEGEGFGLRSMIHEVVQSRLFREK